MIEITESKKDRFLKAIGMPLHKLVEWVAFGVSVSEDIPITEASKHYLTTFILNKFMSIEAVADIMNVSEALCKSDIGLAKYNISVNKKKRLEVFQIIASINHEREVIRLAA